jgi:hypothetical protein
MEKLFRPHHITLVESLRQAREFTDLADFKSLLSKMFSTTDPRDLVYVGPAFTDKRPGGWVSNYTIRNLQGGGLLGYTNCDPTEIKMTETIEELEAKIAELSASVATKKKVEAEFSKAQLKAEFERETPARRLATQLQYCTRSYECTWGYEKSWEEYSHEKELARAERILKALSPYFFTNEHVDNIANAFAGYDVNARLNEIAKDTEQGWK